jgi:putative ABC transport system substrate-binding protein
MKRREFMWLVGGAAVAWPTAGRAQQAKQIGVLLPYIERDAQTQAHVTAFLGALQERGWADGRNVGVQFRYMMIINGGRERTREEFTAIFDAAHFQLNRIAQTQALVSVIEGMPI